MRIFESPGTLKRFRRTSWEFQQTFQTPLKDLTAFVDVIMSALPPTEAAMAVFDQVVFEPHYELLSLYEKYSLPQHWYSDDLAIEAQELFQAVLSEWIDFLFVPTPNRVAIYADHDEYITFFAHGKEQLSRVVAALAAGNFRAVEYVRKL